MVLFRQLLNILILFIILFLILFYLNKIHIQQFSSNEFCKSIFSADNESYFEHKKNSNCKGHYGSKINDSVCCGQNSSDEDKIDNENYICPKDYPICLFFFFFSSNLQEYPSISPLPIAFLRCQLPAERWTDTPANSMNRTSSN